MATSSWTKGIKLRLLMILALGSAALGTNYYFDSNASGTLRDEIEFLAKERIPKTATLGYTTTEMARFTSFLFEAMSNNTDKTKRERDLALSETSFKSMKEYLDQMLKFKLTKGTVDVITSIQNKVSQIDPMAKQIYENLKKFNRSGDEAALAVMFKITVQIREVEKDFDILKERQEKINSDYIADARKNEKTADNLITLVGLLSTIIYWGVGIWLARFFSHRLTNINSEVEGSSVEVADLSQQLADASKKLSEVSQVQAAAIEQAASSLTEAATFADNNIINTKENFELAEDVKAVTAETSASFASLSSSIKEIEEANTSIEGLSQLIEQIGEKTEVIDNIVFKTQLLSFNASVEAERAGQHGRGFAVVAQEVSNLANLSGKSAVEIASIVKSAIAKSREVSTGNFERVKRSVELCNQSVEKMKQVIVAAESILKGCNQILQASQEQSGQIKQVAKSVESLNETIQENAVNAEKLSEDSHQMYEVSSNLKSRVTDLYQIIEGQNKIDPKS